MCILSPFLNKERALRFSQIPVNKREVFLLRKLSVLLTGVFLVVLVLSMVMSAQEVVIYTYDSFGQTLMEMMEEHMQKEYGAKVRFVLFEDTGAMYTRLVLEKDNPRADLVIGLDEVFVIDAKKDDLFQPYRPKDADKIRKELVFDEEFYMTPYDFGYITFNYDSKTLPNPPRTFADLAGEGLGRKIVIPNPMTSSPGQAFLLATIAYFGEDGYLEFWKELKKNILVMPSSWSIAYGIYTNGEAPIVLSYGTSPVYHLISESTERYQALVLDDVAWAQIEGAGIVKGSKNPELAKAALDYLLSIPMQEALPESQFMYPVRVDAKLPESFKIAAQASEILNPRLDLGDVHDKLDSWLRDWENVMR